jgi:hypothetical protein
LSGTGEGSLGVDDPLAAGELVEESPEPPGLGEGFGDPEPAGSVALVEPLEEEPAKQAREDAHGKKEAGATPDPPAAALGEPAAGDDAVQVRVELEILEGMVDREDLVNPGAVAVDRELGRAASVAATIRRG